MRLHCTHPDIIAWTIDQTEHLNSTIRHSIGLADIIGVAVMDKLLTKESF
jgi:hypothetical protein